MSKKRYDVIIVGAGVAGLMLAHKLTGSSLKVLLIERRGTIKKLANSRFGTLRETVDRFGLDDCVIARYNKFAIGNNDPSTWTYVNHTHNPFVVIDLDIFAKRLKLDCDVRTHCNIVKAKRIKDGIRLSDIQGNSYVGKIIADCSGSTKAISTKLGIPEHTKPIDSCNTSLELENCDIPRKYANIGSFPGNKKQSNLPLWIYPYSTDKCQFGHADWFNEKVPLPKNQGEYIYHIMKNVYPYNKWFKNAKIVKKVRNVSAETITRSLVEDNYLALGEAGGCTKPVLGEGSRTGMVMAELAAQIIAEAFTFNDFSKKQLQKYADLFFADFGKHYKNGDLLKKVWLYYVSDDDFTYIFCNRLKKFNETEYLQFYRSDLSLKLCLKMLGVNGVFRLLKNVAKRHLLGIKVEDVRIIPR